MEREIIFGPPGTGKTQTLLQKVADSLQKGVKPERIGYVSFSKRANVVALNRAQKIEGFDLTEKDLPNFRTLHSLAFRLLGIDPSTQLMKTADYQEFADWIGIVNFNTENALDETGMVISKNEYLNCINIGRYRGISLREQYDKNEHRGSLDWLKLEKISKALPVWKKEHHKYDFTDVIEQVVEKQISPQLDVLFVDEAQDLNWLQWQMVHLLEKNAKRSYIAGDDDQAIYTFQGADVDHFLGLEGEKTILSQSYRIPAKIKKLADLISGRILKRQPKIWKPRPGEGEVHWINNIRAIDFKKGKMLVLSSANYMLEPVKDYLESWGYPYQTTGSRGVSEIFITTLLEWEQWRSGARLSFESVKRIYSTLSVKNRQIRRGFKKCKTLMPDRSYTMAECKEDHGLLEDQIWSKALNCNTRTINYIQAMQRNEEDLTKPPRITLSTIHGAKGGESNKVALLPDLSWAAMRSYERNPNNVHRQFYVGITRAKETLYILQPEQDNFYRIVPEMSPE